MTRLRQGYLGTQSHSTDIMGLLVSAQAVRWLQETEVWRDCSLILASTVFAGLEAQGDCTPPPAWVGMSVFVDGTNG